jgi:4'-phosphopantetheinyl transferase EntD
MPLFYQHNIDETTQVGIWRIEEAEAFFLEKVPLKRDVSHPYKRLQHLAGRYLLPQLFPDFPLSEIEVADTRKPFLPGEKYHFSISHCGNYAAAIASPQNRVGVDIELVTPRLYDISHKFLNPEERAFLAEWEHITQVHLELVTILWSAKEAIYKWYGYGQMDFKRHMYLNGPIVFRSDEWIEMPFLFDKGRTEPLNVVAKVFKPLVLAYVVAPPADF